MIAQLPQEAKPKLREWLGQHHDDLTEDDAFKIAAEVRKVLLSKGIPSTEDTGESHRIKYSTQGKSPTSNATQLRTAKRSARMKECTLREPGAREPVGPSQVP